MPAAAPANGPTSSLNSASLPAALTWCPNSSNVPGANTQGVPFEVGELSNLDCETGTVDGVLSWYSLIHHEPHTIRIPLMEFHRALSPRGTLLIGFLEGAVVEQFDHAVTPAYRWPVADLSEELLAVGFDVVESHVRKTTGQRPQAAIIARRADTR